VCWRVRLIVVGVGGGPLARRRSATHLGALLLFTGGEHLVFPDLGLVGFRSASRVSCVCFLANLSISHPIYMFSLVRDPQNVAVEVHLPRSSASARRSALRCGNHDNLSHL
jgi:hypothetical protein